MLGFLGIDFQSFMDWSLGNDHDDWSPEVMRSEYAKEKHEFFESIRGQHDPSSKYYMGDCDDD